MKRRTKIVATLGPATETQETIDALVAAGLDVVRLNLSHGDHDSHRAILAHVREAAAHRQCCVGALLDLQGPKIRIERFRDGAVELTPGAEFVLDAELPRDAGDATTVGLTYPDLPADVAPGDILLLADGLLRLRVDKVVGPRVHTTVQLGGWLSSGKGINRLGGGLSVEALTDKDREDIRFAAAVEADYVAVSFVRDASDIERARALLREAGCDAGVVAKIERREALENLDAIMAASDAVMIARGDLAVEIGNAQLAGVQKQVLERARSLDCVVITATQMMQSMVSSPQPTRAEILDVANAILDGTDAVMLSDETAVGQYPIEAVESMASICVGTERYQHFRRPHDQRYEYQRVDEAIAKASIETANRLGVKAIAALTESGATPMWMSRIGTDIPIFGYSRHERTRRRMALYRCVYPREYDAAFTDHDTVNRAALESLRKEGAVEDDDLVLITKGDFMGVQGGTNTLTIVRVADIIAR